MRTNGANDGLALDDEDRLPWLEPAYDDDDEEVSLVRLGLFIISGLAVLGLIVGGIYLIRTHLTGDGDPQVIAAPQGDYKVPAKDADAKAFEGEGDASFAASEGIERGGRIDPSRLPETPMTKPGTSSSGNNALPASAGASEKVTAPVADNTGPSPQAVTAVPGDASDGPMIQLGAYASDAIARDAWSRMAKRFDYLAALSHSIVPVTVGGTKYYRLRVSAGKSASSLCGRLKVAGESCMVVN